MEAMSISFLAIHQVSWIDSSLSHVACGYDTYTHRSLNVQIIIYYMLVHAFVHFAVVSPGAL